MLLKTPLLHIINKNYSKNNKKAKIIKKNKKNSLQIQTILI